jgi:hypothetical protein
MDKSNGAKAASPLVQFFALNLYKYDIFLHAVVNGFALVRCVKMGIFGTRLGCIEPHKASRYIGENRAVEWATRKGPGCTGAFSSYPPDDSRLAERQAKTGVAKA